MAQDIVANAEALASDIRTTGHAAVYGIYFDTGKSTIKPESAQAIGEIAKLLKADPALKLYVVGHTDNVGGVESNIKLSQDRAEAVLQALVREHGIAAGAPEGLRLRPVRPGRVQRHRGGPGQEPPGRTGQAVGADHSRQAPHGCSNVSSSSSSGGTPSLPLSRKRAGPFSRTSGISVS